MYSKILGIPASDIRLEVYSHVAWSQDQSNFPIVLHLRLLNKSTTSPHTRNQVFLEEPIEGMFALTELGRNFGLFCAQVVASPRATHTVPSKSA